MHQTSTKAVQEQTWLGWKGDTLVITQVIEVWPYHQKVYAQARISPREWYP